MRISIGVGLLLGLTLSLLMWVSASPAQAETADDCQTKIAQVRVLLADRENPNYVDSFTNEKDRAGLIGKLDSASRKLEQEKTLDALNNLTDFRDKVVVLQGQDKIADDDAAVLIAAVDEAIACVGDLRAQEAPTAA